MRSHMMKFYAEEKASKQENGEDEHHFQYPYSSSSPSSSSSEEEYDEEEREEAARGASSYELRENPRKSAVLVDHDFSSVVDRESETESWKKKSICRRSKRVRKSRISDLDMFLVKKTKSEDEGKSNMNEQSSPLSSISDTTPEEHVAHCLIMLSRDKWEKEEREYLQEQEEEDDDVDICEDSGVPKMIKNKLRGKYRCEACDKLFRSYQALGGHRASHKKIKAVAAAAEEEKNGGSKAAAEAKIHQCPFCDRIFSSGQALGGHKRSHFVGANAISTNCSTIITQSSRIAQVLNIDLNLPAPVDDDESSQIAISTVSDADPH